MQENNARQKRWLPGSIGLPFNIPILDTKRHEPQRHGDTETQRRKKESFALRLGVSAVKRIRSHEGTKDTKENGQSTWTG